MPLAYTKLLTSVMNGMTDIIASAAVIYRRHVGGVYSAAKLLCVNTHNRNAESMNNLHHHHVIIIKNLKCHCSHHTTI